MTHANAVRLNSLTTTTAFLTSPLGESLLGFQREGSQSQRFIADYVLRYPVRASAASIEDLSSAAAVSPATLSRFARTLGYAGFSEFRAALADTLQAVLYPVEKLREGFARALPGAERAAEGLEATMSNMRATTEALTPEVLLGVTEKLILSRDVYVMGFGLSSYLSGYLAHSLSPFLRSVIHATDFGGSEVTAGRLMRIGYGDCLVAITLPRYSSDAVQFASFAKQRGAHVVAITDAPVSPIAPFADALLLAEAEHPLLSSCASATMLIVEALVSSVLASQPENVARAEALTEAIAGYVIGKPSRMR
jgi:DNA-binding MurR/RpiR family transcriptional regulator